MRKPIIGNTLEKAKEMALEYIQSDDWRLQFLAVYYLQFYMKPREIIHFLNVQASVIRNNLLVLKKVRRDPKLIKLNSLREVLNYEFEKAPQISKARKIRLI